MAKPNRELCLLLIQQVGSKQIRYHLITAITLVPLTYQTLFQWPRTCHCQLPLEGHSRGLRGWSIIYLSKIWFSTRFLVMAGLTGCWSAQRLWGAWRCQMVQGRTTRFWPGFSSHWGTMSPPSPPPTDRRPGNVVNVVREQINCVYFVSTSSIHKNEDLIFLASLSRSQWIGFVDFFSFRTTNMCNQDTVSTATEVGGEISGWLLLFASIFDY